MTFKGILLDGNNNLIECIETNKMNGAIEWFKGSYERRLHKEPSAQEIKSFYEFKDVVDTHIVVRQFPPTEEKEVKLIWRLC